MPPSHDSANSIRCYIVASFIPTMVICKYDYNLYLKIVAQNIIFYKLLANFSNHLYYTFTHSMVSCLRVFNYNYIYSSLCTLYSNIYKRLAPSQQICSLGNPTLITPIKQSVFVISSTFVSPLGIMATLNICT